MNLSRTRSIWKKIILPSMPKEGTIEEWKNWQNSQRIHYPFRYWLANKLPDIIYDHSLGYFDRIYEYITIRTTEGNHKLDMGLTPGRYQNDELMIVACFTILKNYIENDKAWLNHLGNFIYEDMGLSKEFIKESDYLWKHSPKQEYGLEYLDWEISLDPETTDPTSDSHIARELKELYIWWNVERPKRDDPYQSESYLKYNKMRLDRGVIIDNMFIDYDKNTPEEQKIEDDAIEQTMAIEEKYLLEDEMMLDRLTKIRRYLWI